VGTPSPPLEIEGQAFDAEIGAWPHLAGSTRERRSAPARKVVGRHKNSARSRRSDRDELQGPQVRTAPAGRQVQRHAGARGS
jgi:hypothetical protein